MKSSLPMTNGLPNGYPMENTWVGHSSPTSKSTHPPAESLSNKLKQELDRSIAKHLEKG